MARRHKVRGRKQARRQQPKGRLRLQREWNIDGGRPVRPAAPFVF